MMLVGTQDARRKILPQTFGLATTTQLGKTGMPKNSMLCVAWSSPGPTSFGPSLLCGGWHASVKPARLSVCLEIIHTLWPLAFPALCQVARRWLNETKKERNALCG